MSLLQSILIAIIEGLTEFLPVSSTGHMILAGALLGVQDSEFVKTFEIVIQLGAILAVVVLYYKRFLVGWNIYRKLLVAFVPTGIAGFLLYKTVQKHLFNPAVVSIALIAGGVLLILFDRWSEKHHSDYQDPGDISYKGALQIGLFQCLSIVPGVSRAAATIFGGIYAGFSRKLATEFSFLLAIPTMFAATGYALFKSRETLQSSEYQVLLVGFVVAFLFAVLAVKAFIAFVQKYGFKHFGYYRIALGILFLVLSYALGIQLIP